MTVRPKDEKDPTHWRACGFPEAIAQYVANWPDNEIANANPLLARARRFYTHWRKSPGEEKNIFRHWKALEKYAKSDESLLIIFLTWPDTPSSQPYEMLYRKRRRSVQDEKKMYADAAENVFNVIKFISPHNPDLLNLIRDAQASGGEILDQCSHFLKVNSNLVNTLSRLERLLQMVDPSAKYMVGQPGAKDVEHQVYVFSLASKNQFLTRPQHAAIAYLATVNYPNSSVDVDAIRMVWKRNANTRR